MQTKNSSKTDGYLISSAAMTTEKTFDIPLLRGPVPLSHLFIRQFVRPGDDVVDATCGNGHDTLLLAGLVGSSGTVWAFDVQNEALLSTAEKLDTCGMAERVRLIHAGHETLEEQVSSPVSAVVFNLGYRPGGDRSITTRPDTTIAALGQALKLLVPGGIMAITVYPGHCGGENEVHMTDEWSANLAQKTFHVWRMGQANTTADAPSFILIQKAA
jgi:cyclopropane fatty-acyl-phospholipid synthase-like methyltransferase